MNDRPEFDSWDPQPDPNVRRGWQDGELPVEVASVRQRLAAIATEVQSDSDARRGQAVTPDVLYQYTDAGGLFGICTKQEMWLSDTRYLNDPLEGRWVHSKLLKLVRANLQKGSWLSDHLQEHLEADLSSGLEFDIPADPNGLRTYAGAGLHFERVYLASFTSRRDLLSQWRGYADMGAGVSVGFDLRDLSGSELPPPPELPEFFRPTRPLLFPVVYEEPVQDVELLALLAKLTDVDREAQDLIRRNSRFRTFYRLDLYGFLRTALEAVRWDFKAPGYREEAEWRLLLKPLPAMAQPPLTRVSRGNIVPYFALPLPRWSHGGMTGPELKEIVLGPRCPEGVAHGARMALGGRWAPRITPSSLAFR